ncbi:hypothetical protein DMUE_4389, partial [Dictyocoela muelleri]
VLNLNYFVKKYLLYHILNPEIYKIVRNFWCVNRSEHHEKELDEVLKFFKGNFLSDNLESAKNINSWNLNERILRNIPTPTNSLEAWHGYLNKKNLSPHPNYDKFTSMLRKEEEMNRIIASNLKWNDKIQEKR